MPYGKHKGTPMKDVPASYLLWIYDEALYRPREVLDYIEENLEDIEKDANE